ncbi:class I SAM-dependent methyltransferase [Salsipaludibacter albus]|uniref:class I SAM-dependent methyltransferase n=1 Tax=Salsipaludibacter albus TaxID=2849650 RepID=UPI001EE3E59C|nr:class I SAM-dependent methyltransferase [Salsipaludibacter albus]MBY5161778.1 class I SAM-dependent methyltransferase [Salsipaludibacter albus]
MATAPPADALEAATCFRCGDPGRLEFTARPFGVRRCPDCDIVFISPRLDLDGRGALYDDAGYFEGSVYSGAGDDDEGGLATFWQRRWASGRLDTLARYRGQPVDTADGRLLEVGCAYGLFAARALARGWDVAAMDVSAAGVAATSARLGIDVHHGLLDDAPFAPSSFDVVAAWDVLEHVPDPGVFLARVHDLLVPGGTVALSLPNVASLPARSLRTRWWTLRPDEHIWHFSPETLAATLADAGFTRIALTTSPLTAGNLGRLDSMLAMATRPA